MTLFIGIGFENLGHSTAERAVAWDIFARLVDNGEVPDFRTNLSIIYIAIRIVLCGYGMWSMVGDFMLRDLASEGQRNGNNSDAKHR
jgi:hypothetical protein